MLLQKKIISEGGVWGGEGKQVQVGGIPTQIPPKNILATPK